MLYTNFKLFDNYNFRNLLSDAEIQKVKKFCEASKILQDNVYSRDDGHQRRTKVTLWNHPGDDVLGVLSRMEKIAGTFEEV